MSVKIRLSRQGAKKNPQYLIIASRNEGKRDGEYLARLGHYYPKEKDAAKKIQIDRALLAKWQERGAQVTRTVGQLIKALPKV